MKKGSSGCVRSMASSRTSPKQEENSEKSDHEVVNKTIDGLIDE